MELFLYTDGGARGNPGPGALGAVLKDKEGKTIKGLGKYLGVCTNNEAEYQALLAGFDMAYVYNPHKLVCCLDSELVVKQLKGEYKVKNERLKKFYDQAKSMERKFATVVYKHIPRSQNKEADFLVNETLDSLS